jgi:hypothetical protein
MISVNPGEKAAVDIHNLIFFLQRINFSGFLRVARYWFVVVNSNKSLKKVASDDTCQVTRFHWATPYFFFYP